MRTLCLIVGMLAIAIRREASPQEPLPSHVLASVLIMNPGPTCSGTIISRGERWASGVSAAHCFAGHIGGKFAVRFADGSEK